MFENIFLGEWRRVSKPKFCGFEISLWSIRVHTNGSTSSLRVHTKGSTSSLILCNSL